jgi:hypothetical protein
MSANSIAFSQITGLTIPQKREIVKGLKAQTEYKFVIKDCEERIDDYLNLLNATDSLTTAKDAIIQAKEQRLTAAEMNQMVLQSKVNVMVVENQRLQNKLFLWKGITIITAIFGGYLLVH